MRDLSSERRSEEEIELDGVMGAIWLGLLVCLVFWMLVVGLILALR